VNYWLWKSRLAWLAQLFPFPSLWIFDFQFSPFSFCLRLRDVDSGISPVSRALSEPPRPITQELAFLKKHGLSVPMSFADQTWKSYKCTLHLGLPHSPT